MYRFELATSLLQAFEVDNLPQGFKDCDFTSLAFTQFGGAASFVLLGTSESSMTAYDLKSNEFIDGGEKKWCLSGEPGHLIAANGTLVAATSTGTVARWNLALGSMFPTESKQLQIMRAEGPVTAVAMDDLNNEGLVGTSYGAIFYINFTEKVKVRIVQKAYSVQRPATSVKFNLANP